MVNVRLPDRYQKKKTLGVGGTGEVWLVTDFERGEDLALKVVREDVSPEMLHRFSREFDVLSRLSHPGVIGVLEWGVFSTGEPYYTMPYFPRSLNLEQWLSRSQAGREIGQRPEKILSLLGPVLGGLDHIHSKGILHRDIKPPNILVDDEGQGCLIDFGLAGMVHSELTRTGTVLGTMRYLSPEQARGLDSVVESDFYQVGMVLYRIVSGADAVRDPFEYVSLIKEGRSSILRADVMNPEAGRGIAELLDRALDLDVLRRFASGEEFLDSCGRLSTADWIRSMENHDSCGIQNSEHAADLSPRSGGSIRDRSLSAPATDEDSRTAGANSVRGGGSQSTAGRLALASLVVAAILGAGLSVLPWIVAPGLTGNPVHVLGFHHAELNIGVTRPSRVRVEYQAEGVQVPGSLVRLSSANAPVAVRLGPLAPGVVYTYRVFLGDSPTPAAQGQIVGSDPPHVSTCRVEGGLQPQAHGEGDSEPLPRSDSDPTRTTRQVPTTGRGLHLEFNVPVSGTVMFPVRSGDSFQEEALGDSSTRHWIPLPYSILSGSIEIIVHARSQLDETVDLPVRVLVP